MQPSTLKAVHAYHLRADINYNDSPVYWLRHVFFLRDEATWWGPLAWGQGAARPDMAGFERMVASVRQI